MNNTSSYITTLPREVVISEILPQLDRKELYAFFFAYPEYREYIWSQKRLTEAQMLLITQALPEYRILLNKMTFQYAKGLGDWSKYLQEDRAIGIAPLLGQHGSRLFTAINMCSEDMFRCIFPFLGYTPGILIPILSGLAFGVDTDRITNNVMYILSYLGPVPNLIPRIVNDIWERITKNNRRITAKRYLFTLLTHAPLTKKEVYLLKEVGLSEEEFSRVVALYNIYQVEGKCTYTAPNAIEWETL